MNLIFIINLIIIGITDYYDYQIKNHTCAHLLIIGLLFKNTHTYIDLYGLIILLLFFCYYQQLGAGDIKLISCLYPFFGFITTIKIIWISSIIAIIFYILTQKTKIPFGSCLSISSLIITLINCT